jgi:Cys-rich repeat protein
MSRYVFLGRPALSLLSCALLAVACGNDSNSGSGTPGTGGANGSGGSTASTGGSSTSSGGSTTGNGGSTTGNGGSTGTGGATATGGAAASGSGGAAGSGAAGGAGTGGTADDGGTDPDSGPAPAPSGCRTNADCAAAPGKPLCDAKNDKCVACHTNAQCSAKEECVKNACTPLATCKSSLDCASGSEGKTICDKPNGVCVQCTASSDCGDGKVCTNRVCHTSCDSDNDCMPLHMLCNKGFTFTNQCTECTASSECGAGKYCEAGECVSFTCTPSQQSCAQNNVVQCNDTGSDVIPQMQCTLNLLAPVCMLQGDNAKCVGTCEDKKRDGLETDVDCGGPGCPRCEKGKSCSASTDCSSSKCTSSKCE